MVFPPRCGGALTPPEGHSPWSVGSFLNEWFVELPAGSAVDGLPAVLAVVLQAGHVGAKERGKFASASRTLALVAHLVIQDVRLHLYLLRT